MGARETSFSNISGTNTAFIKAAQSSTCLAMGPIVAGIMASVPDRPFSLGFKAPRVETRFLHGRKPTTPQKEAGIRMDPATSPARANGTHPMATRAASPPDDPPGVLSRSHGFFAWPQIRLLDSGSIISCIVFPLHKGMAPCFRSTLTIKQSSLRRSFRRHAKPPVA